MKIDFNEYLEKQFDDSMILDDDIPDALDAWFSNLDVHEVIDYGQKYAEEVKRDVIELATHPPIINKLK